MTEAKSKDIDCPCMLCSDPKHNQCSHIPYSCYMDGQLYHLPVCCQCKTKFLKIINSDEHFPDGTITGIMCMGCQGKRVKEWYLINMIPTKTIDIYCSEVCFIKTNRKYMTKCVYCGTKDGKPRKCSKCGTAEYCSKTCQIEHWKKEHKTQCNEFAISHKIALYHDKIKHTCYNCFNRSTKDYQRCSGCHKVYYCSEKCQKEHWKKEHKKECQQLKNQT